MVVFFGLTFPYFSSLIVKLSCLTFPIHEISIQLPKVEIKLYKLAISFQNTAAYFLTFCNSGQSLVLFQINFFNILL